MVGSGAELPAELVYSADVADSGYDLVVSAACMIRGHFPNTCFGDMLKALRPGGHMAFTIRDIYLDPATDNGMNFPGALKKLEDDGLIEKVSCTQYVKYKGVQLGSGHKEEGANVMVFRKK